MEGLVVDFCKVLIITSYGKSTFSRLIKMYIYQTNQQVNEIKI